MIHTNVLYGQVLGKIKKLPDESRGDGFLYNFI